MKSSLEPGMHLLNGRYRLVRRRDRLADSDQESETWEARDEDETPFLLKAWLTDVEPNLVLRALWDRELRRAREMILLGRPISAEVALSWGLVNRVSPAGVSVVDDTIAWIEPIANGAPIAQAAALAAIEQALDLPLEHGLALERVHYDETLRSEDRKEALRAFAEKRQPSFEGR